MDTENVTDNKLKIQASTVQEVDTAVINATEQEAAPQPKRRQRPRRKGRAAAGQISRLKLALLCLVPLLLVALWTELAPLLISAGIRGSLFDLPQPPLLQTYVVVWVHIVQGYNDAPGELPEEMQDQIGPDEAGGSGDENSFSV